MVRLKVGFHSYRNGKFGHLRHFCNAPHDIVIAAAARTPWGKYQGQLASIGAWQLGQLAMEAAVKQSRIPLEQIHRIYMNESPTLAKGNENEFIFSDFIKKAKYTPISGDNKTKMKSFVHALEFIGSQQHVAAVVGGLASITQNESTNSKSLQTVIFNEILSGAMENYISKSAARYRKSLMEGIFDSELLPLTVQQKDGNRRNMMVITRDEVLLDNNLSFQYCDGAAALVLTTFANAQKLKVSPLSVLKGFAYMQNTSDILSSVRECVENLFSKVKLDPQYIKHWEIEDYFPQVVDFLKHNFDVNSDLINPHGSSLIIGYSPTLSLARLLTHLTHSLHPLEYGCVICTSYQESLALIIQKLPWPYKPNRLPLVTMYTKDPCPLCDILVEELEHNFSGEYELEKVFINTKDNLRFLRLYRYDIPVVFLNNQFLCMHRLNHRLLRKRLNLIKKYCL